MQDHGFRNRMMLLALLPATLVAILLSAIYVGWNSREIENTLKARERVLAHRLGTAAEYGMLSGNGDALRRLAAEARQDDPDILGISVLGAHGQVLTQTGDSTRPPPELLTEAGGHEKLIERSDRFVLMTPIMNSGNANARANSMASGHVVLDVSRARLVDARNAQILIGLDIAIGGLSLGVWLALRMARGITRPLTHIADVVERIGRGELGARVTDDGASPLKSLGRNINAMAERVTLAHAELQEKIALATEELSRSKEEAELMARTDVLTGLPNRRAFMQAAEQEVLRARRYGTPLSIAMLDLDHFKDVNDSYGHAIGDCVLVNRALLLADLVRGVDMVARVGGEEFAILMPGTPLDEAMQAIERVRQAFERNFIGAEAVYSTASCGVAAYSGDDATVDDLLARADAALYVAKAQGRNRVEAAEQTSPG